MMKRFQYYFLSMILCISVFAVHAAPVYAEGNSNKDIIWNYFAEKGFSEAGIAGIMGNLQAESVFEPNNLENGANYKSGYSDIDFTDAVDHGTITREEFISSEEFSLYSYTDSTGTYHTYGYGLAQWTFYSRKAALYDYWMNYGGSIGDLNMQLDFMYSEMSSSLRNYLKTVEDVSAACVYFHNVHEGSADTANKMAGRITNAEAIYMEYATADPTGKIIVSGANYPGTLTVGGSFSISGTVLSDLELTKVTVGCYDGEGKMQIGQSTDPAGKSYNLKGLDRNLRFGDLKSGEYVYRVEASNEKKTEILVEATFVVLAKSPIIGDGCRIAGSDRFNTSIKSAEALKGAMGITKFDTVVLASGLNFADALSGSYLATVKNAPILLVNTFDLPGFQAYVKGNVKPGGTIYVLGGTSAVSEKSIEAFKKEFNVKRLGGADRFATNLLVLKEAGVEGKDLLICTGLNFADSLSASAANQPLLLVYGKSLLASQKDFLDTFTGKKYIIGGIGAVTAEIEKQIGNCERLAGENRFDTSVLLAKKFFESPKTAVFASAMNFPDGLCGGPLAYQLGAPLLLTTENWEADAKAYVADNMIQTGVVLGGQSALSDKAVKTILGKTLKEYK